MFVVTTQSGMYNGHWLVVRRHDRRVMTESPEPRVCLAWIKTWGDSARATHPDSGRDLSPDFRFEE
jgi:hypothetical protein